MYRLAVSMLTILVCSVFVSFTSAENPDAIIGRWLVGSKKAHVEIFKKDNKYFGKIIWMTEPNDSQGKPKLDSKNPDPSLRSRPIVGLLILRGFNYDEDNTWEDGKIYDPESGKDYSCELTLKDPNTLDVRGYIGFSMIGRSDIWTRVK
jgi:uncharacterized protein (DUF2147 family)